MSCGRLSLLMNVARVPRATVSSRGVTALFAIVNVVPPPGVGVGVGVGLGVGVGVGVAGDDPPPHAVN